MGQSGPASLLAILLMAVSGADWSGGAAGVDMEREMAWTRGLELGASTPAARAAGLLVLPSFVSNSTEKIFAPRGGTATIECHVRHLGDRAVSWIRVRDLHILTIGSITYTADRRFTSSQSADASVWRLTIHPTLTADSGTYECQISTEPKIRKLHKLNITDAVSSIQSGRSVYMREGSQLNITCLTRGQVTPAREILWYRGLHLLNTGGRGGLSINTDKVAGASTLVIWRSRLGDSGDYTCRPSNALPDTVAIHVLTGGDLAAIQEPEGLTGGAGFISPAGRHLGRRLGLQVMLIAAVLTWLK